MQETDTVTRPRHELIAKRPGYVEVIREYDRQLRAALAEGKKVNKRAFYRDIVRPAIPDLSEQGWYTHIRRFKDSAALVTAQALAATGTPDDRDPAEVGESIEQTMVSSQEATRLGIQMALNIGSKRLKKILENPELMTNKEASDLLFKAMKAEDSRVGAMGKLRQDLREEERFQKAFGDAQYDE